MNILICPDKFKGSISAQDVCASLETGLMMSGKDITVSCIPMADGGDGSIAIIKDKLQLSSKKVKTADPLGREMVAEYHYSDEGAFIELASASGLALLSDSERNPLKTTTAGTGILIRDALESGFRSIYLFIGGSATNDGGIGIATALGFQFLDRDQKPLVPMGENLERIISISDKHVFDFSGIDISIFCDVNNPLTGPNGASMVYARQKGADEKGIQHLETGMINLNEVLQKHCGIDLCHEPGMGAAGGVSATLVYLMQAKLMNGFKMLSELMHLESAIQHADLVITGEGKIDETSFKGKVVGNVLNLCQAYDVPCGIVAGVIEKSDDLHSQVTFQRSVIELAADPKKSMKEPGKYLRLIGKEIGAIYAQK